MLSLTSVTHKSICLNTSAGFSGMQKTGVCRHIPRLQQTVVHIFECHCVLIIAYTEIMIEWGTETARCKVFCFFVNLQYLPMTVSKSIANYFWLIFQVKNINDAKH